MISLLLLAFAFALAFGWLAKRSPLAAGVVMFIALCYALTIAPALLIPLGLWYAWTTIPNLDTEGET